MRVEITAEAESDLIARYIAKDDPRAAAKFVRELRSACEGLSTFAKRFPVVLRYESLGIRRRACGSYLIFYRIEAKRVVVIHVLHGARDYLDLLD